MGTLNPVDLLNGPVRRSRDVNSIPGSLGTPIRMATLDAGAIVTAGPSGSLNDASAFNCPVLADLVESDTNGLFVVEIPEGAKWMVWSPVLWHASAVDNVQANYKLWLVRCGSFTQLGKPLEATPILRGMYRGLYLATAGNKLLPASDPVQVKLTGQAAHADTITAMLDGEALGEPVVTGGVTPNEARHEVVHDVEGVFRAVFQAKALVAGTKAGLEVCFI